MTIGDKIRTERKKHGWTQKQLGEKCGIAEPTIRSYELGRLNPKKETIKKFSSALGVSPMYLLGWTEEGVGWTEEGVTKEQLSGSDTKGQKDFNSIGKRIKECRKTLGLSQQELAEKTGYGDRSMISKIERGEVDLSQRRILAFAEVLQISPSYLAGWGENVTSGTRPVENQGKTIKSSQIIGQRIKNLRKSLHLSAEDLAKIVGVSPATIYRYESADIANPGIDKIQPLADALHTTPEYLMGRDSTEDTENSFQESVFFNTISKLCKSKGISPYKACTDIGLNRSAVAKWKNGAIPRGETLERIASYFNVSTDYLLGGEKHTMTITKINGSESVDQAIKQDEPLMAVISFDGSQAYVSHLDDGGEHHILLQKAGQPSTDIDKYFRIIFDQDGADWTFICPPDYKGITRKDKRIQAFYRDGIAVISEFLSELGYLCDIKIPKRYKRHLNAMLGE